MNKSLRVFFLSVLIALLAISSAAAVDQITFTWKPLSGSNKWTDSRNWTAEPKFDVVKDELDANITEMSYYPGALIFRDGSTPPIIVRIEKDANLVVDSPLRGYVSRIIVDDRPRIENNSRMTGKVTIDVGSYGLRGALGVDVFGYGDEGYSELTITGSGNLDVGDVDGGGGVWTGVDGVLNIDAPMRLYQTANVDVWGNAKFDVRKPVSVAAIAKEEKRNPKLNIQLNGPKAALSTSQPSMLEDFVVVNAGESSKIEWNTDASPAKPLTVNVNGNTTMSVAEGKTVTLVSKKDVGTVNVGDGLSLTKDGKGTLVFAGSAGTPDKNGLYTELLGDTTKKKSVLHVDGSIENFEVAKGTLSFTAALSKDSRPEFVCKAADANNPGAKGNEPYTACASAIANVGHINFRVSGDAVLNVGSYAIHSAPIDFSVKGTLNVGERGVFNRPVKYGDNGQPRPLEPAWLEWYGRDLDIFQGTWVSLGFEKGGIANINGNFAVCRLWDVDPAKGSGTINVAGGKELFLVFAPDSNNPEDTLENRYRKFMGSIAADNVGLVGTFDNYPFLLESSVVGTKKIKTMKVYGNYDWWLPGLLTLTKDFKGVENVYLRMTVNNSMIRSIKGFQDNVSVGCLRVSGDIEVPTLIVDGAGKAENTAKITFNRTDGKNINGKAKNRLKVKNLRLHENATEVTHDYYQSARVLILDGSELQTGIFEAASTTGGLGVAADRDSAIAVNKGAIFKISGNIPLGNSILVHEGATLDANGDVTIYDNLTLNEGSTLQAKLTEKNAADAGKFAVTVDKSLQLTNSVNTELTLKDEEIGELASTFGREYKLVGASDKANLKVTPTDTKKFKVKGKKIDDGTFVDGNFVKNTNPGGAGVVLKLGIDIQQAAMKDASYDKDSVGAGKDLKVAIPITYGSRYAKHYRDYIVASPDKVSNATITARLAVEKDAANNLVLMVLGTAHTKNPKFTATLDWTKGTSADVKNTSVASARDEKGLFCLDVDALSLDYFIPSSKEYTLSGNADAPAVPSDDVIVDGVSFVISAKMLTSRDEKVSIDVQGLREKDNVSVTSAPVLIGDVYFWNDGNAGDSAKTYMMANGNGFVEVVDLVLAITDTELGSTTTVRADELTIAKNGNVVTSISVPLSRLGLTGSKPTERRQLALQGTSTNGRTVKTDYVTVAVYNVIGKITQLSPDAGTGFETVKVGTDGKVAAYEAELTLPDGFNAVSWTAVVLPEWLESHDINGGKRFTVKEGVTGDSLTEGSYVVSVVAENGKGDVAQYDWTIKVDRTTKEPTKITIKGGTGEIENGLTYTATFNTNNPVSWDVAGTPSWLRATTDNPTTYVLSGTAVGTNLPQAYKYTVKASENGKEVDSVDVSFTVIAPKFEVEEDLVSDPGLEGYNYVNVITAKNATSKVTWTVKPERTSDTWLTWVVSGDDQLVLTGVLPKYDEDDSDANDYVFYVTASIGTTYADNATAEEPYEVAITVDEDDTSVVAPADVVSAADGVDRGSAGKNYKVTVTFPVDEDGIVEGDYQLYEEDINLPAWLKYDILSKDEDDNIRRLVISVKPTPGIKNGTDGTVRIPVDGSTIGWSVKYNAETAPLKFTLTPNPVSVKVGHTETVKIATVSETVEGKVSYDLSPKLDWVKLSGDTISLTPTASGDYKVTVTVKDSRGEAGDVAGQASADLAIEVTKGSEPEGSEPEGSAPTPTTLTVSATPSSVTFDSPTASAKTVALSSNLTGTTFSATVSPTTGLTAAVSGSTLTLTPSAVGSYVVTVTGKNGTQTKTTTVNVTVVAGGSLTGADLMLQVTGSTEMLVLLNAEDTSVKLTPRNVQGTVSYTSSASWVTVDSATGVVTVHPTDAALAGETHTVTITATDSTPHTNGKSTATVTLTITVTRVSGKVGSSGGGCDAGFGALALVLAAPLFLRRRRS